MQPLPKILRLAVQLPAPFSLSDYEPFTPLGPGAFGVAKVADVTAAAVDDVQKVCRKAFAGDGAVGWSTVERVRAVFFDMDATVINEESLVELARYAGVGEHVAKVTERAMAGELDFAEALKERVALLKGLSAELLIKTTERLTLMRGIQPFVAFCREIGVPCFLVSGGFVQMADLIARQVGFAAFHANVMGVQGGKLTGTVDGAIVDAEAKRSFLLATCARLGIAPSDAAAVGDGANDLRMLGVAGVAVGHKPKAALLPHVHAVNAAGNHAFLGPLLFGRDISVVRRRGRP